MIISLVSDLHLDVSKHLEMPGGDVLLIAGDACEARQLVKEYHSTKVLPYTGGSFPCYDFFEFECAKYKKVFYVMGNHEHYGGKFWKTKSELERVLPKNVTILENQTQEYEGVVFIGATLWTDMNNGDQLTLYHMRSMMNDFRCVQNSSRVVNFKAFEPVNKPVGMTDDEFLALPTTDRFKTVFKTRPAKFSPEDAVEEHKKSLGYIKTVVEDLPPWKHAVVVGHHTPSHTSCHPRYKDDQIMNGGYHSDLSEFILDHPQIKLWTHGHTHEVFDYMIGSTRVVCNPRGYQNDGYSEDTGWNPNLVLEI